MIIIYQSTGTNLIKVMADDLINVLFHKSIIISHRNNHTHKIPINLNYTPMFHPFTNIFPVMLRTLLKHVIQGIVATRMVLETQ